MELVRIDSPSGHEGKVRSYVSDCLSKLGFFVDVDKTGNLFGRRGRGQSVLLSAHLDTVEPGRGIKAKIKNGFIVSSGETILGADNKVAVASILEALENLDEETSFEVIFSVREETDGGINSFGFERLKSKFGLAADTGLPLGNIVLSAPWIEDFEVEVVGIAAHASVPELGTNALVKAVNSLKKFNLGKVSGQTTTNIGVIQGGYATNTVPDKVVLKGEIRSLSKSEFHAQKRKLDRAFSKSGRVKHQFYCPGYALGQNDLFVAGFKKLLSSTKILPKTLQSFGGSDANAFNQNGLKVLNIGDGVENIHTTKEGIKIKDLVTLSEIFLKFCLMSAKIA